MRIAVFSDVHGNLSALQAVLEHIDQQPNLDKIVFAGDLCVFGPRPQACLDTVRERQIAAVVGNTDDWIRKPPPIMDDMDDSEQMQRMRLQAVCRWTARQLDDTSLIWIDNLRESFQLRISPSSEHADDLLIVHANPTDLSQIIFPPLERQIELYGRIRQDDELLGSILGDVGVNSIVFGHLHIPSIRRWRNKQLVNISSVSLPGDGDPRAKYAVLTWEAATGWSVEHFYITYSIKGEIEAFRKHQPPGWEENLRTLEEQGFVPQIV